MSLPENGQELDAVDQLAQVADDAGLSMIELAIAFVVDHPGVTSAIIGPRTIEHLDSRLPAAEVVPDAATLDRIDEIVRPGVNLNPADTSYAEQVLRPAVRRRETKSTIDIGTGRYSGPGGRPGAAGFPAAPDDGSSARCRGGVDHAGAEERRVPGRAALAACPLVGVVQRLPVRRA